MSPIPFLGLAVEMSLLALLLAWILADEPHGQG
jgi:hypothetical protein